MSDGLTWWVRDAANSICGQTGANTHQEKLHEAAEAFDGMLLALKIAQQHSPCPLYADAITKAER